MGEMKDKLEGKAKEAVGTVTGDESQQTEGKAQNAWGSAQGAANDAKDAVKGAVGAIGNGDTDTSGERDPGR